MGNLTSIHDNQKPIISNFVDLDESIDDVFTHTLNSYLFRDNFYYIPNYLTAAIYKFPASHQNFTFLQKCITLVNKYNN